MRDIDSFQAGQRAATVVAMTVICPRCRAGYYAPGASNDIVKDGNWLGGDMNTETHERGGKPIRCRAAKLIPVLIFLDNLIGGTP